LAPPYPKKEKKMIENSPPPTPPTPPVVIYQQSPSDLKLERYLMLGTSLLSAISTALFIYTSMKIRK
jgi:hypothetical protein